MNTENLQELRKTFPSLLPLNGKKPFEEGWQKWCEEIRPFDPKEFNNRNAGILGGPANKVIIFDMDHIPKANKWLLEKGHTLPRTRVHLTGNSKPHHIYGYPENGKRYGCTSVKDPEGEIDPKTGKVITIFDIKGLGGQVVAPGSIHPDTGKPYTTLHNIPIEPAPTWLLDLAEHKESERTEQAQPGGTWDGELSSLQISYAIKKLVQEGEAKGKRSEALMSVLNALVRAGISDQAIISIFEKYQIGEKYREKGNTRESWLLKQVEKVRQGSNTRASIGVSGRVREFLFDGGDGGVFKLSELRRELNLSDKQYGAARVCIKRMIDQGEIEKHGYQLGCYRLIDKKKNQIDWVEAIAKPSDLILPAGLHEVATIRNGDMVALAGFKNHAKSAFAIETVRLNLDKFKVHFFITEYPARMKQRLIDFGVDLHHPNLFAYQIEKSDYIPDKIEPGEGVLNVIDHLPNIDSFYLVGKTQDEIHRSLNGAICVITHQKKNPNDLDAIGGTFWQSTPTLAITLFWDDTREYQGRLQIQKGKEPGKGRNSINNLSMNYRLDGGCKFKYDPNGWKY